MEKQRSSSKRKMYTPSKIKQNSTPVQDFVLERLVSKFFRYLDVDALRQRAIQNIQDKIATIENAEQISKKKKERGCNKRVISFQNSLGCVVRMSDDYNVLSNKPLVITDLERKKKLLKLTNCNKNNKRVKSVQKVPVSSEKLKLSQLSKKISRGYNKDRKRLKRAQKLSALCQKLEIKVVLPKLSKQILQSYNKDSTRIESEQEPLSLDQKLETKNQLSVPVRSSRIKTPVVKFVPDCLALIRKLWWNEKNRKITRKSTSL